MACKFILSLENRNLFCLKPVADGPSPGKVIGAAKAGPNQCNLILNNSGVL